MANPQLPFVSRISGVYHGWWIVLSSTTLGTFAGAVYFFGFSAFFLSLEKEFDAGFGKVALIAGLGNLVHGGIVAPLLGPLIDRHGPRPFMLVGVALLGLGFVLLSTATSMTLVYVYFLAFISVGVGMGVMLPATAVLPKWFVKRRGTVFGLHNTGLGIGAILVIVTGFLIDVLGWKETSFAIGVAAWVIGFPAAAVVRSRPEHYGLLPDGVVQLKNRTSAQLATEPEANFTSRQALSSLTFWFQYLAFALRMLVSIGIIIHFVPAIVETGVTETAAAGYLSLFGFLSLPARFLAGAAGDRIDKRLAFASLTAVMAFAAVALVFASNPWMIVLFVVLFAIGSGGSGTLMNPISADNFGRQAFGAISGYGSLVTVTGTFLGPVLAGFIYDATAGYSLTMYTFAGIAGASIVLISLAKRPRTIEPIS